MGENKVVLVGLGNIGQQVLGQLYPALPYGMPLVIADSKHAVALNTLTPEGLERVLSNKHSNNPIGGLSSEDLPGLISQGDIVINCMPTITPSGNSQDSIPPAVKVDLGALNKGAYVVAAHKSAFHGGLYNLVTQAAESHGVKFVPSGVVMGPTRVAEVLCWLHDHSIGVIKAEGVLGGTPVHILDRRFNGTNGTDAVNHAKQIGIAEPDPSNDTKGYDALHKGTAIAMIAGTFDYSDLFGINDVRAGLPAELKHLLGDKSSLGIEGIPDEVISALKDTDHRIALVATYANGNVQVGPRVLTKESPFYALRGTQNCLSLLVKKRVPMGDMLNEVYGQENVITGLAGKTYAVRARFQHTPASGQIGEHTVYFIHNPNRSTLTIRGLGAGSAETAAGLVSAVGRIMYQTVQRK